VIDRKKTYKVIMRRVSLEVMHKNISFSKIVLDNIQVVVISGIKLCSYYLLIFASLLIVLV
jgi:hypothetical protein